VMGRQVEETMVAVAVEYSRRAGSKKLRAQYIPTAKNKPCHEFWTRSGFDHDEAARMFTWNITDEYPRPSSVELCFPKVGPETQHSQPLRAEAAVRQVEPAPAS
jgi:hypothetical protein